LTSKPVNSHATSSAEAERHPMSRTRVSTGSAPTELSRSHISTGSTPTERMYTSSAYVDPIYSPSSQQQQHQPAVSDLAYTADMRSGHPNMYRSRHSAWNNGYPTVQVSYNHNKDPAPGSKDSTYGATFMVRFAEGQPTGHSHTVDMDCEVTGSPNRVAVIGDKPQINLVTERLKRFESLDSVDNTGSAGSTKHWGGGAGSSWDPTSTPNSRTRSVAKLGCNSVASKTAYFEAYFSDDSRSGDDDKTQEHHRSANESLDRKKKISFEHAVPPREPRIRTGSLPQAKPPPETPNIPSPSPATINIYFRGDQTSQESMKLQPSPERYPSPLHTGQYSSSPNLGRYGLRSSPVSERDRSPLKGVEDSPNSRWNSKATMRQQSNLTAINSAQSKCE